MSIAPLDWFVIAFYLALLLALAFWLSKRQFNREDYYVGGRTLGKWPVAISIMATQCSTNSILGAPAFVAFTAGGGLLWLQYELAVPLAMIALMLFIVPTFRQLNLVSIYEYLEKRFGVSTRVMLSGLFMFVRAFATAVTVYSIAIVVELISGIDFIFSVILLGAFTAIYDSLGGIKGVIYSDVIQMAILVVMLIAVAILLTNDAGGIVSLWENFDPDKKRTLDFSGTGFDGSTFAFWPMLFGGLFLYVSYYGCDQSQTQRVLSTKNIETSNAALMLNGLMRFPVVALYCFIGVGIAVYAQNSPEFISLLSLEHNEPNVNLAVPVYMMTQLPAGVVGLGLVALFAAAMSSLDSVLSSLSATSMEDFVRRFTARELQQNIEIWIARSLTLFWGALTLTLAFFVDDIAPTVLEAINKIGSLVNGPILGVFTLGLLTKRCHAFGANTGLILGFTVNLLLWLFAPNISWLWWNLIGFAVTWIIALLVSIALPSTTSPPYTETLKFTTSDKPSKTPMFCMILAAWFALLFFVLLVVNAL